MGLPCVPCAMCRQAMLVTRSGLIQVHGPLHNRSAASRMPPIRLSNVTDRGDNQTLPPFAPVPQAVQVMPSPPK